MSTLVVMEREIDRAPLKIQGDALHAQALTRAHDSIIMAALAGYRMAGFPRPFGPRDERFYHLFRAVGAPVALVDGVAHLSLCQSLAVLHPDRLRPAYLPGIDCIACLDAFAAEMRAKR